MAILIETTLISGFLGSGKTTYIQNLLAHKPRDERWLVLVNEFGQAAYDTHALQNNQAGTQSIYFESVVGGCMCCSTAAVFSVTINRAIKKYKPDHILIEPSGMAHIQSFVKLLKGQRKGFEHYAKQLHVLPTTCLVDPQMLNQLDISQSTIFLEQLENTDHILLSKTDMCADRIADDAIKQLNKTWPYKTIKLSTDSVMTSNFIHDKEQLHTPNLSIADNTTVMDDLMSITWQLPPHAVDIERIENFLNWLKLPQSLQDQGKLLRIKGEVVNASDYWSINYSINSPAPHITRDHTLKLASAPQAYLVAIIKLKEINSDDRQKSATRLEQAIKHKYLELSP